LKKQLRYLVLLIFLTAGCGGVQAQGDLRDLNEAKAYFTHEKYADALSILLNSGKLKKANKEARLLIAICYYELNKLDKAMELLRDMVSDKKAPYPECWLFLAKCYHASNQFAKAGNYYKLYLRAITPGHPNRRMVREEIKRIANGIQLQYRQPLAVVENLGRGVNTEWDEMKPIPSKNASRRLYFSSARRGSTGGARNSTGEIDEKYGHYFSDIYTCQIQRGIWGSVMPLHYLLNSPQHEILYDFNRNGKVLFYFKGWNYREGEVVVDTFKTESERTLNSTPFVGPVLSSLGDGDLFFYNDTILLFSSNRKGGYGGKDIYRSYYRDGRWSIPENLGEPINTPFDERSPFLAADGKTLYFSSNDSHKSIGGYDIFKSVYVSRKGVWTNPSNLGIPLNSAGDDVDFRLHSDGFTAFFTSSRKDGFGRRDLYTAYFQNFLKEMNPPEVVTTTTAPIVPPTREEIPAPEEEPVFPTLVFDEGDEHLDADQQLLLDGLLNKIGARQDLELIITVYAQRSKDKSSQLVSGMEKGELVARYLLNGGVQDKKIIIRAILVPSLKDGSFLVDFAVGNSDGESFPVIGKNYETKAGESELNAPLYYQLQVSSSKKLVPLKWLNLYGNPMIEKRLSFPYYRYSVGGVKSFEEASALKSKLAKAGKKDAYVAPYIYGVRAGSSTVSKYASTFPDLKNFLK